MRTARTNNSGNHPIETTGRLSGGPSLPQIEIDWYKAEAVRVGEVDGIRNFSVADLLHRIYLAKLDLTNEGIERYKEADKKATDKKATDKKRPSPQHQRGRPPLEPSEGRSAH